MFVCFCAASPKFKMQRGNSGPLRTIVLFCMVAIVLLSFLYVMKRMEAKGLNAKLEVSQVRKGGREGGKYHTNGWVTA